MVRRVLVSIVCLVSVAAAVRAQQPAANHPGDRVRGVRVTLERDHGRDGKQVTDTRLLRLFSLAVERGETPSPLLAPGFFRATFAADVSLPVRDRHRFRLEGRGRVTLSVNGEKVLDGTLRPDKPIETAAAVRLQKGDNRLQLVFESSAMGDGQVRLSWAGADFGFEPIAPERLSWSADDAELRHGAQRQRGQALFAARRCARCHEPEPLRVGESAFAELDATGPDLRTIGGRVRQDWLAAFLRDPRRFRSDTSMPRLRFEREQDADDVAAWLAGTGVPLAAPEFDDAAADAGAALFRQFGCVACHVTPGGDAGGPELERSALDFVGQKWHPAALVRYLQEPRGNHDHARMPDFRLQREQAMQLAALLLLRAAAPSPLPASHGDAEHGRHVVQQHGCIDCHAVDVPLGAPRAPQLANLDADRGCLATKADPRAPDHGLSAEQLADLRAFLPFAATAPWHASPIDFATRQLTALRCTACHALDGEPSTWARWARAASATQPLPAAQDPIAQAVPALTWVGAKLQPSWLDRFVRGQEPSPRPWLHARMPSFDRHGAAIASGLVRGHGYGSADEPPVAADAQMAIHGERLLAMGKGFGCVQCHALGDQPAVQVFEREGIELLTARRRLRHEYYTRWLLDPTRLDPDSRMPKFADARGRTALTDVLGGDAAQQFESIWQYLGSRLPKRH
ncbi:MAG: c-type cytochrome [Planctomycetes bacterium]|nr:c-type cytochrome [Planctomycetota bacterium]